MQFLRAFMLSYAANPRVYDCCGEAELRSPFGVLPYVEGRDAQMLLVLRAFVADARTEAAKALKLYLLLTLKHYSRLYPSIEEVLIECAIENLKRQSSEAPLSSPPPSIALPPPEELHAFTPSQLGELAAIAATGEHEAPDRVHFVEDSAYEIGDEPSTVVLSHSASIQLTPPLTTATSVLLNRIARRKPQKTHVAVFLDLSVRDVWPSFVAALARANVKLILVQQQVSDYGKESLDDAGVFYFERLGEARIGKVLAGLHTTLFESAVEFLFSSAHSAAALPNVSMSVVQRHGQVSLDLHTERSKAQVSVFTSDRRLIGTSVPLRWGQAGKQVGNNLAELCCPRRPTQLGKDLASHSLLFIGETLRPLIESGVSDDVLSGAAHALLADAVGDNFFQELDYVLRTHY